MILSIIVFTIICCFAFLGITGTCAIVYAILRDKITSYKIKRGK